MTPKTTSPRLLAALLLLAPALSGCWIQTQRYPGPMVATEEGPLPAGTRDLFEEGPEEVVVTRFADPVFVRRPGEASSFPLYFYRKQERLTAGSWVFCGAGGRVEILYPEGTSVTLYGRGAGVVGSESRSEPLFFLQDVDRARIELNDDEQIRLVGGAVLTANGGPIALETLPDGVLRVLNRSLGTAWIAYRDEVFQLDPAEGVDLPLLDGGTGPVVAEEGFRTLRVGGDGLPMDLRGEVEVSEELHSTRVLAVGDHEVRGLGITLRLGPGEEALLGSLARKSPEPVLEEDTAEVGGTEEGGAAEGALPE